MSETQGFVDSGEGTWRVVFPRNFERLEKNVVTVVVLILMGCECHACARVCVCGGGTKNRATMGMGDFRTFFEIIICCRQRGHLVMQNYEN